MTFRRAFTLIELLLVIGIIGILSAVTIVAVSPGSMLLKGKNAARRSDTRAIENAILQLLIRGGAVSNVQYGIQNAKDICRQEITGATCTSGASGVDLSVLVPDYLASLPVDPGQTGGSITGYRVYKEGSFFIVCSPVLDPSCGGVYVAGGGSGGDSGGSGSGSGGGQAGGSCNITPESYAASRDLLLWVASSPQKLLNDQGQTSSNGDSIVTWLDLSSLANHLTQATLAFRPTFLATNGGSVHFDGNNDSLETSAHVTNFEGTTVVVFKGVTGSQERALLSVEGAGSEGSFLSIVPGISVGNKGLRLWHRTAHGYLGVNTCLDVGSDIHYVAFEQGASPKLWLDGKLQVHMQSIAGGDSYATIASPTRLLVGNISDSIRTMAGSVGASDADVLEVISYGQKLSSEEHECLNSYLQQKWSIPAESNGGTTSGCYVVCCLSGPGVGGSCGCGNGNLDAGEQCDDGNAINGDGCGDGCQSEGGQIQTRNGGTFQNVATGMISWGSVSAAQFSDNQYASAQTVYGGENSHFLLGTNFGFNIPSGATITGIVAHIERSYTGYGSCSTALHDSYVLLAKGGTLQYSGSNKAGGDFWGTTDTVIDYGAEDDLWGSTWTPAEINSSGFGVAIQAQADETFFFTPQCNPQVDEITLTVYYDP
jgi:prepilin-type N-terminal cleavage/methylation domain-containing protein